MTARFLSNLALTILGLLEVMASVVYAATSARWLGFAGACAVTAIVLVAFAFRGRGVAQRVVDVVALATAGWTVVAALCFTAPTARWLCFAAGWAFAGFGMIGLALEHAAWRRALVHLPALPVAAADSRFVVREPAGRR